MVKNVERVVAERRDPGPGESEDRASRQYSRVLRVCGDRSVTDIRSLRTVPRRRHSASARRLPRCGREHRPPTGCCPTLTGIPSFPLCARPPATLQLVVVGQFFARRDRSQGFQVHPLVLGNRLAVRFARVVEVACLISSRARIDDRPSIYGKQKHARSLTAVIVISGVGLQRGKPLAGIFDDPGTLADAPAGERTVPLNGRRPNFKEGLAHKIDLSLHSRTGMRPTRPSSRVRTGGRGTAVTDGLSRLSHYPQLWRRSNAPASLGR